jgi:F0F1-type ATP synthase membrane subunit b/b'
MRYLVLAVLFAFLAVPFLTGCESEEPTIGERIDRAIEEGEEAAEEAREEAEEAAEDAEKAMDKTAEDVKKAMEDTGEEE